MHKPLIDTIAKDVNITAIKPSFNKDLLYEIEKHFDYEAGLVLEKFRFLEKVPEDKRQLFLDDLVNAYTKYRTISAVCQERRK